MNDKSVLELKQIQVLINLGELKLLEEDNNGNIGPVTRNSLNVQVWGHRADGLDPLIQPDRPSMFEVGSYVLVNASLF